MTAILLTPPAAEPWSVAEIKTYLRVGHDDDDAVIAGLIAAARGQVEALTRCALIHQVWRLSLDDWPRDGRIVPRISPLREVLAASVYAEDGTATSLDLERFVTEFAPNTILVPNFALPRPGVSRGGIRLDLKMGYGASAADVPGTLRHAVRMLVAHWYENRGLAAIGASVALLPGSVAAMIAQHRVLAL